MKTLSSTKKWIMIATSTGLGLICVAAGCASNSDATRTSGAASTQSTLASASDTTTRGGAELWADTCSRCHNIRPPEYYSDAQWATIVHHMRIRANLTGAEAREITKFLQASN